MGGDVPTGAAAAELTYTTRHREISGLCSRVGQLLSGDRSGAVGSPEVMHWNSRPHPLAFTPTFVQTVPVGAHMLCAQARWTVQVERALSELKTAAVHPELRRVVAETPASLLLPLLRAAPQSVLAVETLVCLTCVPTPSSCAAGLRSLFCSICNVHKDPRNPYARRGAHVCRHPYHVLTDGFHRALC